MKRDPFLSARFRVAHELRRTIVELDDMSIDEFVHWVAYFKSIDGTR